MKPFENLPKVTQHTLGGLQAGPAMKAKILIAAKESKTEKRFSFRRWAVPVISLALVVCVGLGIGMKQNATDAVNALRSTAAGYGTADGNLQAELQPGSVVLSAGSTSSSYGSIWAPVSGSYYPMLCVNGQYYRLLSRPTSVTASLKGSSLGTIAERTSEPALCSASSFSNTVNAGETVYAVSGMQGAAVIANVGGTDRVFQRVSFSGSAVVGSESFADTLKIAGHVTGMELSGVGTITDGSKLSDLTGTLLQKASFVSANASADNAPATLLIQLDNGITMQLGVKDGVLTGCGAWSNPAFIEAFTAAVQ